MSWNHLKNSSVCSICLYQFVQNVNLYKEESNLCLLAPTHGILSAFLFDFTRRKSAFLLRLLLLYSVICLNTPDNISTCSFLKSWSVEFRSDGLNFSLFLFLFWKALDKWNWTINRWKIDIITMLINLFLSISDRRKIIKKHWKILFLSSLVHNLAIIFFKWCWNKSIRYFLFLRWI